MKVGQAPRLLRTAAALRPAKQAAKNKTLTNEMDILRSGLTMDEPKRNFHLVYILKNSSAFLSRTKNLHKKEKAKVSLTRVLF